MRRRCPSCAPRSRPTSGAAPQLAGRCRGSRWGGPPDAGGAGQSLSGRCDRAGSSEDRSPDRASAPSAIVTLDGVALLERAGELSTIKARRASARQGRGGMVVVSGEPGAGKTSLMQAFVDGAATDDVSVGCLRPAVDATSARAAPRRRRPARPTAREALTGASQSHEIFAAVFAQLGPTPSVLRGRRPALGRPGDGRSAALRAAAHRGDAEHGGRLPTRRRARR